MSITLYSKYRRQNLRHAWKLAGMDSTAIKVAIGILLLLVVYGFVSWIEASIEEAEQIGRMYGAAERESLTKSAKALAHAMNGGSLTDGKSVYFFQVSEQKGLK